MKSEYADIKGLDQSIQEKIVETDASLKKRELDIGVLGKFFGCSNHASKNIAGLIAALSLLTAILVSAISAYKTGRPNLEIWSITTPLITGSLGFLFGRSGTKEDR